MASEPEHLPLFVPIEGEFPPYAEDFAPPWSEAEGSLRLHPLITRLVDEETLKKMGAEKLSGAAAAEHPLETPLPAGDGKTVN